MIPAFDRDDTTIATPFGTIAWRAEAELHFPLGMPGFGGINRFLLAPVPDHAGPFQLLHGLGEPSVDLVVVPLDGLETKPAAADVDATRESLGIPAEDLLVLCIVTLPRRGSNQAAKVNVRAPIFVDVARRLAVQMVLTNAAYRFREPLVAA